MRKLSPVGWLPDGSPIWPVAGGDGEGGSGESGGDGTGTTGGTTDPANTGAEESDDANSDDPGKLKAELAKARARVQELSSENANRRVAGKTVQQQLEEAQAKLRGIEDKDKSETELAKRAADEAQQKLEAKEAELNKVRIQNAFFSSNKYEWQNAAHAMALADMSDVKIEDDGKVSGLDKALDALAKSHKYLLKNSNSNGAPSGTPASGPANAGRTGGPPGTNNRPAQESRFPALRSRPAPRT